MFDGARAFPVHADAEFVRSPRPGAGAVVPTPDVNDRYGQGLKCEDFRCARTTLEARR